uniref:Nodule cysteine-rich protein 10 n=1 Tax=Cicer arietinum TaxID=3827 RepID=A0A0U8SWL1_CICAR|nr:TPA_exp: nodule cysteine-rich protein 10 [Cicer arietinum]
MVGIVKFVRVMVFFFFLFNIGMNLVDMCKHPGSIPQCHWGWCICVIMMGPLPHPTIHNQLQ